jgi:transposase
MAQTVSVIVSPEDRARLAAVIRDRNRPLKHVQRVRIVLLSADRLPVLEIARQAGVSRPSVWRWQRRFAEKGVDVLLREPSRKPGKAPVPQETVRRVVALTCAEPPGTATHWSGRAMAKAVNLSLRAIQRIWEAHRLQPHRIRTFKRSNDPAFAAKVEDVVGLYMDPPVHAVVVSIDEKSQIAYFGESVPAFRVLPRFRCTRNKGRRTTTVLVGCGLG